MKLPSGCIGVWIPVICVNVRPVSVETPALRPGVDPDQPRITRPSFAIFSPGTPAFSTTAVLSAAKVLPSFGASVKYGFQFGIV
jgi:hypothetical protein